MKRLFQSLTLIPVVAMIWFLPAVSQAQVPNKIGSHGKWTAYTFMDGKSKVCYMASAPTRQKGKYTKRGPAYALVTNRPSTKSKGEVNFVAGYSFKKESAVKVTIAGRSYELFTTDDRAWSKDAGEDAKLVRSMIKGNNMVVVGTSSRGTKTTDTYSLSGFTKTKQLIDRECK